MNLSIVMMKQGAICVVISASRDNWNLHRPIQFITIGTVCSKLREQQKKKRGGKKVITLQQNSLEPLFTSGLGKFIWLLYQHLQHRDETSGSL